MQVKLYISNPDNSPEGSLMDHPTAVVNEPYSLLGQLLTVELDRSHARLYQDLCRLRRKAARGEVVEYDGGGEGHYLTIRNGAARIETIYEEPNRTCQIPLADFWYTLDEWFVFVKKTEVAKQTEV